MSERRETRISKYLARHLRHQPDKIGLTLDASGWAEVDALLDAAAADGFPITRDELERVVAANDKQRYAFDASGRRIRAQQGHSVRSTSTSRSLPRRRTSTTAPSRGSSR